MYRTSSSRIIVITSILIALAAIAANANWGSGYSFSLFGAKGVAAAAGDDTLRTAVMLPELTTLPMEVLSITTMTLDRGTGGETGQYTSQAIVNGNPAISYYNVTDQNLMFARNSAADGSGTWAITTVDINGNVGQYTSLMVVNGNPAISYYDVTNVDLKYVRSNDASGTNWGVPVTVSSTGLVGDYTSLEIVNGNPAISYYDSTNFDLKYVRATDASGTSWGIPLTPDSTGAVGQYTSLTVVNGNPAISYYELTNSNLKYVRATDASGTSWGTPLTLDSTGTVGLYTSLEVVDGNPAISYYNQTNGDLKYVRATDASGTSWGTPLTLDSTGIVGYFTSLEVVGGNPAISYWDPSNRDLKYIRATDVSGTSWGTSITVDSVGLQGMHTSLAVVDGNPGVSYYDQENAVLRYVRATDVSGTTWAAAVTADAGVESGVVGESTSQALVNGNPAVSYYDFTNGTIKYLRAMDPSGTIWGTPLILVTGGNLGVQPLPMSVVNGNPAIGYVDPTNYDIKYLRANDASGTSWGTPVNVANTTGTPSDVSSLAVVNGNPAICFQQTDSVALRYVRATDASGTSWGAPITLDSTGLVGGGCSMAVVNGNPAVSYHDFTNLTNKYVRANDASGTSWGAPLTIGPGNGASLAVINGNPAISYQNSNLKYVRATDANGTTWGTPLTLDSTGNPGADSSLVVVNGNPAVSSYDLASQDLRYVQANDANGTSWATPMTIDSTGAVGKGTSLAVVNGNPAISYHDETNGDLKWATILAGAPTSTATTTPTTTATSTNTPTPTATATQTFTPTPTATETFTPTPTATETFTPTPADTPTSTATNTSTATPTSTPVTYTNPAPVTVNPSGAGTPYPSTIGASGFVSVSAPDLVGTITKVTVDLVGVSHTNPDDMDILLVGPGGQNAIILSDVGGGGDISTINLTLDDDAAALLPDETQVVGGTFKPTNFDTGSDAFPTPAPAASGGSALSVFNGTDPNGTWSLYIYDDQTGEAGSISGGWSLNITTEVGASISGTVTYGNAIGNPAAPRFVKNVSLSSTAGSPAVGPVITGTPGTYALTGFGAGSYTIKPTKPGGSNGAITSNDAARVAQGVTGSLPFVSNNQRFAADVSGNGVISSTDAAKIAQFAAGLPFSPPNFTGEWRFFTSNLPAFPAGAHPQERTYASVTSNATGEDYIGILIGDTSGNWNPATHPRPVGGRQLAVGSEQEADGNEPPRQPKRLPPLLNQGGELLGVELPQVAVAAGKEIVVPVNVLGVVGKGIISYEFDLRYDPAVVQPLVEAVDVAGTVSRGLSVVVNPYEPGLLRVVVYGALPIDEDGVLLNLRFMAVGAVGSVSPLTLERIMFNEGEPGVRPSEGRVEISN